MSSPSPTRHGAIQAYERACGARGVAPCEEVAAALLTGDRELALASRDPPLTDADLAALAELLSAHPHPIRCLSLEDNAFTIEGAMAIVEAIAANPNIVRELRMGRNRLTDPCVVAIANRLLRAAEEQQSSPNASPNGRRQQQRRAGSQPSGASSTGGLGLKILDVSENGVTNHGCVALCQVIGSKASDLVEVSFHNNEIDKDAASALATAIIASAKLKHLHLGYNKLKDAGATQLARCIPIAPLLSTLDLTANRIGPQGGKEIARALLVGTTPSSAGGSHSTSPLALAPASSSPTAPSLSRLQRLNLRSNEFDDETLRLFADVISRNTTLTQLSLGHMKASRESTALVLGAALDATVRRKTSSLALLDLYAWPMDLEVCGPLISQIMLGGTNGPTTATGRSSPTNASASASASSVGFVAGAVRPTTLRAITSDACQPIFHAIDKHNWERQEKALHDIYIGPDDRHSAIAADSSTPPPAPVSAPAGGPSDTSAAVPAAGAEKEGEAPIAEASPSRGAGAGLSVNPIDASLEAAPSGINSSSLFRDSAPSASSPDKAAVPVAASNPSSSGRYSPKSAALGVGLSGAQSPSSAAASSPIGQRLSGSGAAPSTPANRAAQQTSVSSSGLAAGGPSASQGQGANPNVLLSNASNSNPHLDWQPAPAAADQQSPSSNSGGGSRGTPASPPPSAASPLPRNQQLLAPAPSASSPSAAMVHVHSDNDYDLNSHLLLTLSQLQMKTDMQHAAFAQRLKSHEERIERLEGEAEAREGEVRHLREALAQQTARSDALAAEAEEKAAATAAASAEALLEADRQQRRREAAERAVIDEDAEKRALAAEVRAAAAEASVATATEELHRVLGRLAGLEAREADERQELLTLAQEAAQQQQQLRQKEEKKEGGETEKDDADKEEERARAEAAAVLRERARDERLQRNAEAAAESAAATAVERFAEEQRRRDRNTAEAMGAARDLAAADSAVLAARIDALRHALEDACAEISTLRETVSDLKSRRECKCGNCGGNSNASNAKSNNKNNAASDRELFAASADSGAYATDDSATAQRNGAADNRKNVPHGPAHPQSQSWGNLRQRQHSDDGMRSPVRASDTDRHSKSGPITFGPPPTTNNNNNGGNNSSSSTTQPQHAAGSSSPFFSTNESPVLVNLSTEHSGNDRNSNAAAAAEAQQQQPQQQSYNSLTAAAEEEEGNSSNAPHGVGRRTSYGDAGQNSRSRSRSQANSRSRGEAYPSADLRPEATDNAFVPTNSVANDSSAQREGASPYPNRPPYGSSSGAGAASRNGHPFLQQQQQHNKEADTFGGLPFGNSQSRSVGGRQRGGADNAPYSQSDVGGSGGRGNTNNNGDTAPNSGDSRRGEFSIPNGQHSQYAYGHAPSVASTNGRVASVSVGGTITVRPGHTTPHRGPGTNRPATDFRDPYQDADQFYGNPTGRRRSVSPSRLTNEHTLDVPTLVVRDEKVDRCYQPNEPSPIAGACPSPSLQTSFSPAPNAPGLGSSQPMNRPITLPRRKVPRPTSFATEPYAV